MKTTMRNAIIKAVEERNAAVLARTVDVCRFKFRMNYGQVYRFVNNIAAISLDDFEQLMYEADTVEAS